MFLSTLRFFSFSHFIVSLSLWLSPLSLSVLSSLFLFKCIRLRYSALLIIYFCYQFEAYWSKLLHSYWKSHWFYASKNPSKCMFKYGWTLCYTFNTFDSIFTYTIKLFKCNTVVKHILYFTLLRTQYNQTSSKFTGTQ